MAGLHVDAEQIAGLDHIGGASACARPLPCQRSPPSSSTDIAGAGGVAQPIDQRFQMRETAHAAIAIARLRQNRGT